MDRGAFNPEGAVEFDLPRGIVRGGGDRLMIVPASILEEIAATAGAVAAIRVARAIGTSCGQRAAQRMGGVDAARGATIDDALSHLAGELALSGAGVAYLERWGRALVLVVSSSPIRDAGAVAAFVEGAIAALVDRPVASLVLSRDAAGVRVLIASAKTVVS